ncbi:MAG: type IV pilus modification protein PilV [Natronospirillum sp.]
MSLLSGRQRQRGVSLLEVLVAMTVLAIGLLGMAALLGNAMQYNQGAQARTQAVLLANDMVERVRANRPNRVQYAVFAGNPLACNPAWTPVAGNTVAQNDISEWLNNIGCNLPGGVGEIQVDGDMLGVAVGWTDTTGANAVDENTEAQELFVMSFQL